MAWQMIETKRRRTRADAKVKELVGDDEGDAEEVLPMMMMMMEQVEVESTMTKTTKVMKTTIDDSLQQW